MKLVDALVVYDLLPARSSSSLAELIANAALQMSPREFKQYVEQQLPSHTCFNGLWALLSGYGWSPRVRSFVMDTAHNSVVHGVTIWDLLIYVDCTEWHAVLPRYSLDPPTRARPDMFIVHQFGWTGIRLRFNRPDPVGYACDAVQRALGAL